MSDRIFNLLIGTVISIAAAASGMIIWCVHDIIIEPEAYNTVVVDAPAETEEISPEMQEIIDSYSEKYFYDLSINLMGQGYTDNRTPADINDEEYIRWREENLPVRGLTIDDIDVAIPVEADGELGIGDLEFIKHCIATVPESFIQKIADDGWKVIVREDEISVNEDNETTTTGQTNWTDKTITVSMETPYVIYHELGHVAAGYAEEDIHEADLDDFSMDGELSRLYCHTAEGSVYVYMNPNEQIAESFYDYIWYPREMQAQAPSLYEAFENAME